MNFYGSKISQNIARTPEGYLICRNVNIGRVGAIKYLESEINPNSSSDRIVTVFRTLAENSNPATLASFEGKPITDGHPDDDVCPENYHYLQKGHIQNVRADNTFMIADLFISDPYLIDEILKGGKREVSCGYDTIYQSDNTGNLYQTHIRGNHLAIVDNGRAGSAVRIKDSKKELVMAKKIKTSSVLKSFISRVKDADTTEELNKVIDETAEELVEAQIQDVNLPAEGVTPEVHGGGIDQIMAAIKALEAKVNQIATGKPQSDGTPEGDLDKAVAELQQGQVPQTPVPTQNADPGSAPQGAAPSATPPQNIDPNQLMDEEPANLDPGEGTEEIISQDGDADVGENNSGLEIDEQETIMNDTAVRLLAAVRSSIATIKDPAEKRRVADAALNSVRHMFATKGKNSIRNVAKNYSKQRDSSSVNLDISAQSAYDKLNPRMAAKYGNK